VKIRTHLLPAALAAVFISAGGSAKTIDTCFSPRGLCDQVLVSWINVSEKTLDAAIYGLTDVTIAQALIEAHARGVTVRVVHDKTQAAGRRDVSELLIEAGIPVHIQRGSRGGILHDKFLIIDGKYVVTGSFNWTNNAVMKNDENFVVLDDQAANFQPEFERLWSINPDVSTQPRP
jgi:phosphatidylserine/phosphatidylglycerophosphate/cardiolipin synthase-like enzyme